MKLRTKLLLVLMIGLGLGIGILSGLEDGLYSAVCLFLLPMFVVLAGASIIADLSQEQPRKIEAAETVQHQTDVHWPHAA